MITISRKLQQEFLQGDQVICSSDSMCHDERHQDCGAYTCKNIGSIGKIYGLCGL